MEIFVNYSGFTCHFNMFCVIFPTHTSPLTVACMSQQPDADRIHTTALGDQGWMSASFHTAT